MTPNSRILSAEAVGTAVLMIGGPGSAILAADRIGVLGVSLAFGLSLLIMAYAIGHVSGCHINPAVTLAMVVTRQITVARAVYYWVGQIIGAAIGGLIIWGIASGLEDFDATNNFAANGWGDHSPGGYGLGAAIVVEIIFTAILVFVVLSTTNKKFTPGMGGITAGLTLALIHLVSIPVDNTSVNPARSFGAAIFAGGDALAQLPIFIIFPLVGALVGVVVWLAVDSATLEDTMLDNDVTRRVRDAADSVADRAVDAIGDATN